MSNLLTNVKNLLENNIPYSYYTPDNLKNAFEFFLNNSEKEYQKMLTSKNSFETFDSEISKKCMGSLIRRVSNLKMLNGDDEIEKIYVEFMQKIQEQSFNHYIHDDRVYKKLVDFQKDDDFLNLNPTEQKIINKSIKNLENAGVNLPTVKKNQLIELETQRHKLSSDFESNMVKARASVSWHVLDNENLSGIPERSLKLAKSIAQDKNVDGYIFDIVNDLNSDILLYAENRDLRERVYKDGLNLNLKSEFNNKDITQEILNIETKMAFLLGFENPSFKHLSNKMVKEPQAVGAFLDNLGSAVLTQAKDDFEDIKAYGQKIGIETIQPWDTGFIRTKMKKENLSFDEEQFREYFPVSTTIGKIFNNVEELFQIQFSKSEEKTKLVWKDGVFVYDVLENNTKIGELWCDLFQRKGKQSGAWMDSLSDRSTIEGETVLPIAVLTCNIQKGSPEKEATMSKYDIDTFYHELGHCLHHVLTKVPYDFYSGINNVEFDAVELPSQFMENLALDYDILRTISGKPGTNEKLDKQTYDSMIKVDTYQAAIQIVNQVMKADIDLHIYNHSLSQQELNKIQQSAESGDLVNLKLSTPEIAETEKEISKKWNISGFAKNDYVYPSFSHIFAGGYSTGYYGYHWAEVMSSDCFKHAKGEHTQFYENGKLKPDIAERMLQYKQKILEKGGEESMSVFFKDYVNREPNNIAFFERYNLPVSAKASKKPKL